MIYIKIHRKGDDVLLAACDEDVLGKNLTEGELCLAVSREFYGGELVGIEELAGLMEGASMANLTGSRVVERAVELGTVKKNCVMEIAGVKHAQVINVI